MRLIDGDSLDSVVLDLNTNRNAGITRGEYKLIDSVLFEFPVVDAVPVVYGRWILRDDDVRCKVCNTKCLRDDIGINILSNYCPYCGARMDGRREDGET